MAALHIVNPGDAEKGHPWYYRAHPFRYVFWFGTCAPTFLMVWGRSLEDALETAAEYLAEHAPGHIMTEDSEELADLRREACEEAGLAWPPECDHADMESEGYYDAFERAEADLTRTESGYLTSYEWGIQFDEHASRADVKAWITELEARHYGDGPAVLHPGC